MSEVVVKVSGDPEHGSAEDVNILLGVGAAMRRGDWKAVHEGMAPYFELARQHLGLTLPPDLQAKVEAGEMTGDAAKELSVSRLANARLTATVKATGDAATAAAQREANDRVVATVQSAAEAWEAATKARDPDYQDDPCQGERFMCHPVMAESAEAAEAAARDEWAKA